MSLISIKQYLDHFKPGGEADSKLSLHGAACGVLVNEVRDRLFPGTGYAALLQKWGDLAPILETLSSPEDLERFQVHASLVLTERQTLESEKELIQRQDVRHMLGVLNEALLSLASGNEGSVDRLNRVETALRRTSQLNDLAAMKASLTDTMRMVHEETELTWAEGTGALQKFDAELQRARSASQRFPGLLGKAEAIRGLAQAAVPGARASLAVACQLDQLRIIGSRYGAPIADDLLMAFVSCSAANEGDQAYRWAEDGVLILHGTEESTQEKRSELEERFAHPFERKVVTGGRAALLSVSVRWMCTSPADTAPPKVTEELEAFFEGRRWRP